MRLFFLILSFTFLTFAQAFSLGCNANTQYYNKFNGSDAATSSVEEDCDSSGAHTTTFVNNAQLDTAQKKFGTASLLLDGTDDYVTVADSDDFAFGSGNFTIDFWFRIASEHTFQPFGQVTSVGTTDVEIVFSSKGSGLYDIVFRVTESASITISVFAENVAVSTDTWHHYAIIRGWGGNANDFAQTLNGSLTVAAVTDTTAYPNFTSDLYLGVRSNLTRDMNGWLDNFHITKEAVWTEDFSANLPTTEYPTTESTSRVIIIN